MKHTKYKTIQFDDEHHVLRRRITGNVTEKNINNINKVISSRSKIYKFTHCGSDERQYNYPGIDLPIVTVMRTKFSNFKE